MAEQIVIDVQGTADIKHHRPDQTPDPKRCRPVEYIRPDVELVDIGELIARGNPYWPDEANRDAEENPGGLTPKALARKWAAHRTQPRKAA